ncbi:unnamed protein product [Acanthoscelides obtectus]|uniref:C2H2-type domain-containing protein n=1 Tax=Acanthoscelides obtectus TaxID=200917 RepID=A0A9P0P9P2_ACAOB|nr:unnamed protein product [Acanthoscelides obtectus]CAK1679995.1 hypothetical protein AOBTE_LOCUS32482 [Acanthoscelides obtectus]
MEHFEEVGKSVSIPAMEDHEEIGKSEFLNKCAKCERVMSNLSNLRRHVKSVHPGEHAYVKSLMLQTGSKSLYSCEPCKKIFTDKFNYARHLKSRVHTDSDRGSCEQTYYFCNLCKRYYSDPYSFKNHVVRKHKRASLCNFEVDENGKSLPEHLTDHEYPKQFFSISRPSETGITSKNSPLLNWKINKCSLCDYSSKRYDVLMHYIKEHKIVIKEANYTFTTIDDFFNWKAIYEKETNSKLIKDYTVHKNDHVYRGYKCHRSGNLISQSRGIKRARTSIKIDGYCPASIKLKSNGTASYDVHVIETHVGHNLDLTQSNTEYVDDPVLSNEEISTKQMEHDVSLKMDFNSITCTDDGWNICSYVTPKELNTVRKVQEDCDCDSRCLDCQGCIHEYVCSCIESSQKQNMCRHIHLVCRYNRNEDNMPTSECIWRDVNASTDAEDDDTMSEEQGTAVDKYPSVKQDNDESEESDLVIIMDEETLNPEDEKSSDSKECRVTEDSYPRSSEEELTTVEEHTGAPSGKKVAHCTPGQGNISDQEDSSLMEPCTDEEEALSDEAESKNTSAKELRARRQLLKQMREQLTQEIAEIKRCVRLAGDPDEVLAIQRCVASIISRLNQS